MKKVFVGIDESYDMQTGGTFVLCFFEINGEKNYTFLVNAIEKVLASLKINEMKNKQSSAQMKNKYFKKLKNITYKYYIYTEKITSHKNIKIYYENGINKYLNYLVSKYDFSEKTHLDIKLDEIFGPKIHKEITTLIATKLKHRNLKTKIRFENSKSSIAIQFADLFAGEYRNLQKNKDPAYQNILNKNKTLL